MIECSHVCTRTAEDMAVRVHCRYGQTDGQGHGSAPLLAYASFLLQAEHEDLLLLSANDSLIQVVSQPLAWILPSRTCSTLFANLDLSTYLSEPRACVGNSNNGRRRIGTTDPSYTLRFVALKPGDASSKQAVRRGCLHISFHSRAPVFRLPRDHEHPTTASTSHHMSPPFPDELTVGNCVLVIGRLYRRPGNAYGTKMGDALLQARSAGDRLDSASDVSGQHLGGTGGHGNEQSLRMRGATDDKDADTMFLYDHSPGEM